MSTPGTFYDAKRALVTAAVAANKWGDRLSDDAVTAILNALGWPTPAGLRDGRGRKVKVFCDGSVGMVLPEGVAETVKATRGPAGLSIRGYLAAPTMKATADVTTPSWVTGRRRTESIREVKPTDMRYLLAAQNPGHLVLTADGTEFGEPVLIPVENLRRP